MSKIGCQSQSGTIQDFTHILDKHPIAWKLLGQAVNLGLAQTIRAHSPQTLIILRAADDNWSLDAGVVDYASRAMRTAEPFLQAGCCDLLESPNEPVVGTLDLAKRLNAQMVQLAQIYKANGFKPLAYNFSVGNPDYSFWPYLCDGINYSDGWLGLHQYGAPSLQTNAQDLSLRHRKVYPLLTPQAQANLKIIISEAGIDLGVIGQSGGYRALPKVGDSDDYWIKNYVDVNLSWWDGELAKDPYVIASTIFGYSMVVPWVGMGFDVADVDTDRAYFINWIQSGASPVPPNGGQMEPTPAQTVATVPFLVKASLQSKYGPGGLGNSIYGQYDAEGDGNELWRCWIFLRGGLKVKDGNYADFSGVKLFNPIDGTPLTDPLPWPTGGSPIPPTNKRLTTADLPPEYGILVNSYTPKAGEKFFGLVGAGNFKSGPSVGTQTTLIAVNEQGSPVIGYSLTHAYDQTNQHSETFPSPSVGIILGPGSYYTPPQIGGDHFYISKGAMLGVWPAKYPSDEVIAGMPNGQHFEATYTFQLMTG